jgi:ResB-like family
MFGFLASYGFACVLFILLLVLTYLGTVEQVDHGLYDTQQKYFESLVVVHDLFGVVPLPLPGARLLLVLVFVNLVCGGIVRARKGWGHAGILIAHVGIAVLLIGSMVKFLFAVDGHMTLFEGQQSNEFESYYEWEIAVSKCPAGAPATEYIVPGDQFTSLEPGDVVSFVHGDLPFTLVLSGYTRNSMPRAAGTASAGRVVDGFYLEATPFAKQAEQNIAGAYVTLRETASGQEHHAILWGVQRMPYAMEIDSLLWTVDLRKRTWPLPFVIALDKFTHELHPRTNMPRAFMSEVSKIEGGTSQTVKISMNAPLRDKGYTLFQASWNPGDPRTGRPVSSTFAVVRDPADQFPLYACVVITFGLALHFALKLLWYLRAENRRARS